MTVDAFWRLLKEQDGYQTPGVPTSLFLDRALGRLDSWYYLRLACIIAATSIEVRRKAFSVPVWGRRTYAILRAVEGCGGRISVSGIEHLKKIEGPVVYVANHMSMIETLLLPSFLLPFGILSLVVKRSLTRYPIFGAVMKACHPVTVNRNDPREDLKTVLQVGTSLLNNVGRSVIIFPQSTRSVCFHPSEFNSLGVKLARKAAVPLVPIALKTDFHGNGRRIKDIGPIDRSKRLHFRVGAPITVTGNGRDAHRSTIDFISTNLKSWEGLVAEPSREHAREGAQPS